MTDQTILLVEDSDEDFEMMVRAFREVGVTNPLTRCEDGEEVLDYLFHRGKFQSYQSAPRPKLIMLDLNLPGVDGREVILEIKGANSLKDIPLIVLTTSNQETDVRWCYEVGANCFITKPLHYNEFLNCVSHLKTYWFEVATLPKE